VQQLEFHGHYSKYWWEILSNQRMVCLLALTSGAVSWVTMVSESGLPLLGLGSAVFFLYWLLTLTHWPATIFFGMKLASLNY
jgi:hypothetical protein